MNKDVKICVSLPAELMERLREAEGLFGIGIDEIIRRNLRRAVNKTVWQSEKCKMPYRGKVEKRAVRMDRGLIEYVDSVCDGNRSEFISRVVSAGLAVDIPKAKRRHSPLSAQAIKEIGKLRDCERYAARLRLELGC